MVSRRLTFPDLNQTDLTLHLHKRRADQLRGRWQLHGRWASSLRQVVTWPHHRSRSCQNSPCIESVMKSTVELWCAMGPEPLPRKCTAYDLQSLVCPRDVATITDLMLSIVQWSCSVHHRTLNSASDNSGYAFIRQDSSAHLLPQVRDAGLW